MNIRFRCMCVYVSYSMCTVWYAMTVVWLDYYFFAGCLCWYNSSSPQHISHPCRCLWIVQVSCSGCWSSILALLTWLRSKPTSSHQIHAGCSTQWSGIVHSLGPFICYRKASMVLLCFCEAWGCGTALRPS